MSLGKLGEAFVEIRAKMDSLEADLNKAQQTTSQKLQSVGDQAAKVGGSMAKGLTLPLVGVGIAVAKVAGDFQSGMNQVRAVSGATGSQFDALKAQAQELGRTTQFSASQAADAMGFLAMAGFDANQILEAMPGTLQLAAAANLDLGRSADIVSNILTGYGMEVSQLSHVNDVLVAAMTNANVNLEQMGEAMKYAGPVASAAGLSFEETAAAIALMGNAGIQGSMAGTSLRGALTQILNPSAQATEVMNKYGISLTDAAGNVLPLVDVVGELERAQVSAGDMMILFGQRAGPAMAALVDQGSDALRDMQTELENSGGTAERIAAVQMEGFNGSMKALKSALEGLMIAIGDAGLLDALTRFAAGLTSIIQRAAETSPQLLALGTGFAVVLAAAGPIILIFGKLVQAAVGLHKAFMAVRALLAVKVVLFAGLSAPILLVVAAVAALAVGAVLLYKNWDTVRGLLSDLAAKIPELGEAFNGLKNAVAPAVDLLGEAFQHLVRSTADAWGSIVQIIVGAGEMIIGVLQAQFALVGGMGKILWATLKGDFEKIPGIISETWDRVGDANDTFVSGMNTTMEGALGVWDSFTTDHRLLTEKLNVNLKEAQKGHSEFAKDFIASMNTTTASTGDFIVGVVEMAERYGISTDHMIREMGAAETSQEKLNLALFFGLNVAEMVKEKNDALAVQYSDLDAEQRMVAESAREVADALEDVGVAAMDAGVLQGIFEENVKNAAAKVSEWENNLSGAEKALEILHARQEAGHPLSAQEQSDLEILTWMRERATGGIEDEQAAYVHAEAQKARYIQIVDELNQAVADNKITQEEANEAIGRAAAELDPAAAAAMGLTDAQTGLADAVDKVIDKLRDLLIELGIIPPDTDVNLNTNADDVKGDVDEVQGAIDGVERDPHIGFTADTSQAQEDAHLLELAVLEVERDPHVGFTADTSEAEERVSLFQQRVEGFPEPDVVTWEADTLSADTDIDALLGRVETFPQPEELVFTADGSDVLSEADAVQGASDGVDKSPPPVVFEADTADAIQNIRDVDAAIDGVRKTFTITPGVNLGPFYQGLTEMEGALPKSPAKHGPLAFTPNWDWLFAGLEESAGRFTESSLKHIRDFVDTAQSAFQLLSDVMSFSDTARGFTGLAPESAVQGLVDFSVRVVAELQRASEVFGEDFVAASEEFTKAAKTGMDILSQGADVVSKLSSLPANLDRAMQAATDIKFLTEHIVLSLGDSAAWVNHERPEGFLAVSEVYTESVKIGLEVMTAGADTLERLTDLIYRLDTAYKAADDIAALTQHIVVSLGDSAAWVDDSRPEGFINQANLYMESAEKGVELIAKGADLMGALSEVSGSLQGAKDAASDLKFLIEHIVLSVGDSAALVAAERPDGFLPQATVYAEAAEKAMALMVTGTEALEGLQSVEIDLERAKVAATQMKVLIEHVVTSVGDSAQLFSVQALTHIGVFSDAASKAMSMMQEAVPMLAAALDFEALGGTKGVNLRGIAQQMGDIVSVVVERVQFVAAHFETEGLAAVSEFSDAASKALDVMGKAGDALQAMLLFATIDQGERDLEGVAGEMATLVEVIILALQTVAARFETSGLEAVERFAASAEQALQVMSTAGEALQAMLLFGELDYSQKASLEVWSDDMVFLIDRIIRDLQKIAEKFSGPAVEHMRTFAEAAKSCLDLMKGAVDLFEGMAEASKVTPAHADLMVSNFEIVIDVLKRMAEIAQTEGVQEAIRYLNAIMEIKAIFDQANAVSSSIVPVPPPSPSGSGSGSSSGGSGSSGKAPTGAPVEGDGAFPPGTGSGSSGSKGAGTTQEIVKHPDSHYVITRNANGQMISSEYYPYPYGKSPTGAEEGATVTQPATINVGEKRKPEVVFPLMSDITKRHFFDPLARLERGQALIPKFIDALSGMNGASGAVAAVQSARDDEPEVAVNYYGPVTINARDRRDAERSSRDIGYGVRGALRRRGG